jgi:hypothetical protein
MGANRVRFDVKYEHFFTYTTNKNMYLQSKIKSRLRHHKRKGGLADSSVNPLFVGGGFGQRFGQQLSGYMYDFWTLNERITIINGSKQQNTEMLFYSKQNIL